jgi:guanylate kinase
MKLSKYGANYVITIPKYDEPQRSKSGKSVLIASSRGVRKSKRRIDGRSLRYLANVFYYPDVTPRLISRQAKKRHNKRTTVSRRLRRRRQR